MNNRECVEFLQWALPRLAMQWSGFRKVRRQACRRISQRMTSVGMDSPDTYRRYLESHPDEWAMLDACCRITISRFNRDHHVFEYLRTDVLPTLARAARLRDERTLRVLSTGAAAGEEPYTVSIVWRCALAQRFPDIALDIVTIDSDATMLARAEAGVYAWSSIKELPCEWRDAAFEVVEGNFALKSEFRSCVSLYLGDIRETMPEGVFDLILCRNLVFTYFDEPLRWECLARLTDHLCTEGALVIGAKERLPSLDQVLETWSERHRIYRRV